MLAGFRAAWRGLRHFNHRGYIYVWGNLLWVILSLPVITAPAAWAALVKMSFLTQTTPSGGVGDMWEAFRFYLRQGLIMGVVNIILVGVTVYNLAAYWNDNSTVFVVLRGLWFLILAVWLLVQFYMWPLYFAMKQPSLGGALRNAVVMVLLNPGFTLALWLVVILVVVVSTFLFVPLILLTGGALACIATAAVLDRLESAGIRERPASSVVIDIDSEA
jgi:uncharacterized membrane protein YesL